VYGIVYQPRAVRVLKKLDATVQRLVLSELERLAAGPSKHPNAKRLQGISVPAYRLRIGRWRVLYLLIHPSRTIEVLDMFIKKSRMDYERRLR
jgi:mRNA interferase RelE/StbE